MRTSFISLILLLLLGACSRPEVTERLAHAERIMNAHPDSALQLLRAIDAPHKLRGKDRADYAWLLTQAYDKNFLDSLQSDSLIALATNYYADNADAVRAGKAFFYQGKVLALQGKDSLAMVSYLEAGSVIGYIGITGNANPNIPHLHLGIRSSGQWTNPADYLNATITTTNVKIVTPCD